MLFIIVFIDQLISSFSYNINITHKCEYNLLVEQLLKSFYHFLQHLLKHFATLGSSDFPLTNCLGKQHFPPCRSSCRRFLSSLFPSSTCCHSSRSNWASASSNSADFEFLSYSNWFATWNIFYKVALRRLRSAILRMPTDAVYVYVCGCVCACLALEDFSWHLPFGKYFSFACSGCKICLVGIPSFVFNSISLR